MSVAVKICGLTLPEQAEACVEAGADAIGLIFFPRSPRHVTEAQAAEICAAVSDRAARVGVFVDASADDVARIVGRCALDVAQLHGAESADTIQRLQTRGVRVVKALKVTGDALLIEAERFACADALLVECGKGVLPGGNGAAWDWSAARPLAARCAFALAGGLTAETVAEAIRASGASAVDVSSAVERAPGDKDLDAVRHFIDACRATDDGTCRGRVF